MNKLSSTEETHAEDYAIGSYVWRHYWRGYAFSGRHIHKSEDKRMSATGIAMTITLLIGLVVWGCGMYLTRKPD